MRLIKKRGATVIASGLVALFGILLKGDKLPVSPSTNQCAQISYSPGQTNKNGPCYNTTGADGPCTETDHYIVYVSMSNGTGVSTSPDLSTSGNGAAGHGGGTSYAQCPATFNTFLGTDPDDSTRFQFTARARDQKPVSTGLYSEGCGDDTSNGTTHDVSWTPLKPSCPTGGGGTLNCTSVCGNSGTPAQGSSCPTGEIFTNGCCCAASPIVIDAYDEGFHLTSLSKGVKFRPLPTFGSHQMSWTDQQWRNGWLALDRNGNGMIDDFTELFGNFTPQPANSDRNGYLALAVFDDPASGGNGNGVIDPGDSVYNQLRLWVDTNHNGISEPEELHALSEMGIFRIDLKYHFSNYVDDNGNQFRYKARLWDEANHGHDVCYDVFVQVDAAQN